MTASALQASWDNMLANMFVFVCVLLSEYRQKMWAGTWQLFSL